MPCASTAFLTEGNWGEEKELKKGYGQVSRDKEGSLPDTLYSSIVPMQSKINPPLPHILLALPGGGDDKA